MQIFIIGPDDSGKLGVVKYKDEFGIFNEVSFKYLVETIAYYFENKQEVPLSISYFKLCWTFMFFRFLNKRTVYHREIK